MLGENINKILERGAFLDSDYIGSGHRDIVNAVLAEMQHVAQHFQFQRRHVGIAIGISLGIAFMVINDLFDLRTQAIVIGVAE